MTGKEMIKLFKKNNWRIVSVKGSHYKMRKKNQTVIISHHTRELKRGLQNYLLRQLKEVN